MRRKEEFFRGDTERSEIIAVGLPDIGERGEFSVELFQQEIVTAPSRARAGRENASRRGRRAARDDGGPTG